MNQKSSNILRILCLMRYKMIYVCLLWTGIAYSQNIVVDNTTPRLDTDGNIVDAHDGRLIQFGDMFYWYGTSYGSTNGFTVQNHYVCYSSKDLKIWKKEGRLLTRQPKGVYYRPHVVYNKKNKRYVLWYNWYPKLWDGQFGVAISKSPTGPFKIINDNVKMLRSDVGLGDFGLFVDDDQKCYLSYNTIQNHQVSVEKLDDDYTASSMENGGIIAEHMEAGTQFKKNGKYYLLTDYTCCFCNYGSGARVYMSDNPLRGYVLTNNINRYSGNPSFRLNNGINRGTVYEVLKRKKQGFDAIEINFLNNTAIDKVTVYQFTGNRPENCGDVKNPRVHPKVVQPDFLIFKWDFNKWIPVEVKDNAIVKTSLRQKITLTFDKVMTDKIKIVPKVDDVSYNKLYINEIEVFHETKRLSIEYVFISGQNIPQKPIIPAQQSYVTKLKTNGGEQYFWIGDLWGSASDDIKGHDYQYWSSPLKFNQDGTIKPLKWDNTWTINLSK